MTDRPDDESTLHPSRRRFLGGMAALGAGVTLSSYVTAGEKPPAAAEKHLTGAALDPARQRQDGRGDLRGKPQFQQPVRQFSRR